MNDGVIASVLRWLRAGYPEGVPAQDYSPLLALLRRTLTADEFTAVIAAIEMIDPDPVQLADIRTAIEQVTDQAPTEDEIRQVAARLAAAGWPLSTRAHDLAEADGTPAAPARGIVAQVLDWLRAGYPQGVPPVDYFPLLALLRRRLTDEQVGEIAEQLVRRAGDDGITHVDAQVLMTKMLGELPSDEDIERVRAHLAAIGWALT